MSDDARAIAHKKVTDLRGVWAALRPSTAAAHMEIPETYNRMSLLEVCDYGDLPALQALIAQKVHLTDNDDFALQSAALYGHTELVRLLLENGANVHAADDMPIRWAAEDGRTETVKLLLEHGANAAANNNVAIRAAAKNGHFDTVVLLAQWGESPDILEPELLGKFQAYQSVDKILRNLAQQSLPEAFKVAAWVGHVPEMLALWQQVPEILKPTIDFSHVVSSVRSQSLKQSSGNKPQMIGRHKHD
jgi:hypothetical protein